MYMNETNLTIRQKAILTIINKSNGLSREEIQKSVEQTHEISKPTLIRDLTILIENGLIISGGQGKNTKYLSTQKNPLLRYFDIDQYFLIDPDYRIDAKKSFDFKVFDNLNGLFSVSEIEEIGKIKKSFSKQTGSLSPDILRREMERFIIELSWKSSKIEGNTYSLLETESLIKESKEAPGKTRDEAIMILNHKSAFDQILKDKGLFNKLNFSVINQLHNTIVKNLNITTGIRTHAVGITGTVYKPLDNKFQIEEAIEKLINVINNKSNLHKALIATFMISYIQPYADGNKRTSRMLTNAILLAYDYYPLSYRSVDEDEYKKAMILFYEQGSIFHLKRIFLQQLKFAYKTYFI